ncbi:hypothetical protein H9Y04_12310 [Streptomyces sp. TRM66268-LWL]|uniref:Uncharacterized protein n=1 Tax=Streptomyces polyasparticus TaxID=2767826 RepID=A0ABR7SGB6_9ACTN|nr:hypothetical protein [Streptomyces polyasparticus]MBC9713353.1 hypothetical protein [Streptomyces polyasparticus]
MASYDTGRLTAIVKILDHAGTQLRLAAREQGILVTGPLSCQPADAQDLSGITSLLAVVERASGGVRRALAHLRAGDTGQAQLALEAAGTGPRLDALPLAALPRPLPGRVTAALQLMRGISGFFAADTEEFLVRQLSPAGRVTGRVAAGVG